MSCVKYIKYQGYIAFFLNIICVRVMKNSTNKALLLKNRKTNVQ